MDTTILTLGNFTNFSPSNFSRFFPPILFWNFWLENSITMWYKSLTKKRSTILPCCNPLSIFFYLWARNPFLTLRVCSKCLTSCNCLIWKPLKATENLFLEKSDDSRWLKKGVRAQLVKSQQSFGFSFLWNLVDSSLPKAQILLPRNLGHLMNLPRDSKNSTDSILGPIFGTAETSHISPPDAILMRMQLF